MQTTVWTTDRLTAALAECKAWEGTPHFDRIAVPGRGIDCLHLVGRVLIAAGVLPEFRMPFYRPWWGAGRENNVMERIFMHCCHAGALAPDQPAMDGDVAVFQVGKQSNHVGIVFGGKLWHALAKSVVQADDLAPFIPSLQSLVRLTDVGFRNRPEELTQDDLMP